MTGINIRKARCAAAVIASALTGVGGLMLLTTSYIYPQVGYSYILTGFAVVILGGLGSVGGVVVASLVIGIVTELVTSYISASDANLVPFVVILVVLLLRPSGIFARAAA
jgi:branched-chain amino acid transport system permease protein